MNHQAGAQLRLEPGCFRRHYITCIGNIHQLFHRHRIKRQRNLHLPGINTRLQLSQTTDTANEINPLVRPLYKLYTKFIIPAVGRLVSKDNRAYTYLPESIAAVPQGDDMLRLIREAGFTDTTFRRLTFGVCTIYTARRPE